MKFRTMIRVEFGSFPSKRKNLNFLDEYGEVEEGSVSFNYPRILAQRNPILPKFFGGLEN